jgi:hypothetical protein
VANPLDSLTQDQSDDSTPSLNDVVPRPRVYVYGDSANVPEGDNTQRPAVINAPLAQAVAPQSDDLSTMIGKLKDKLLGTGGQERYQFWPERTVREGLSAAHDVIQQNPYPEGSEEHQWFENMRQTQMPEAALRISSLASPSGLIERPGAATLGSTAVRAGVKAVPEATAPVFYSALEHAATNAAQDVMSPQQWLGYLKNQPGVKKEELDWSGLEGWLGEQKGKVKKEDVQSYLDAHKTEIKDVSKSGGPYIDEENIGELAEKAAKEDYNRLSENERKISFEDWLETDQGQESNFGHQDRLMAEMDNSDNGTKYSSYQLPGGENYREHLLTLPEKKAIIDPDMMRKLGEANMAEAKFMSDIVRRYPNGSWRNGGMSLEDAAKHQQLLAEMAKYRELSGSSKQARLDATDYRSSHWDEPNVLAHMRTNDRYMERTTPKDPIAWATRMEEYRDKFRAIGVKPSDYAGQGKLKPGVKANAVAAIRKEYGVPENATAQQLEAWERSGGQDTKPVKSLHIEEIQSDWHQEGRKQGYKGEIPPEHKKLIAERDKLAEEVAEIQSKPDPNNSAVQRSPGYTRDPEWIKRMDRITEINKQVDQPYGSPQGVPDAPFKTSWPELALKRMIRYAAENDYDRISWTPGEAQAARYDLSKHIDELHYNAGNLVARDANGREVIKRTGLRSEDLPDIIGKEAAERLLKQEPKNGWRSLEGANLKIGGEGMREFYDKMLPKMAEKIGKAHGVKVKQAGVNHEGYEIKPKGRGDGGYNVIDSRNTLIKSFDSKAKAEQWVQDNSSQSVHYFDLPQSLKDTALNKGFPLYMHGVPFPLVPVDGDPFAKKKDN